MMKLNVLPLIALAAAFGSIPAQAYHHDYGTYHAGLGFGLDGLHSNVDQLAGELYAELYGHAFGVSGDSLPAIALAQGTLDLTGAVSGSGVGGGFRARINTFLGGHSQLGDSVCSVFGGAHLIGWAAQAANQPNGQAGADLGVEAGLLCYSDDGVFMIAPSADIRPWGNAEFSSQGDLRVRDVLVGGVARLAIGDALFLQLRAGTTVNPKGDSQWLGQLSGNVELGDDWRLLGYVELGQIRSKDGQTAAQPGELTKYTFGSSLIRTW